MPPKRGVQPELPRKNTSKGGKSAKSKSQSATRRKPSKEPPTEVAGAVLKAFQQADLDGNGEISEEELRAILGSSMSAEEVHALVIASDSDMDGVLDYSEFIHYVFSDSQSGEQLLFDLTTSDSLRAAGEERTEADDSTICKVADTKKKMLLNSHMQKTYKAALKTYPDVQVQVTTYFKEIKARLSSKEFDEKVQRTFVAHDVDHSGGSVSFEEVSELIRVAMHALTDLVKVDQPTEKIVRDFFDAYDTGSYGRGEMGPQEFLTFMQGLHFKIHVDLLPSNVEEWRKAEEWNDLASTLDRQKGFLRCPTMP